MVVVPLSQFKASLINPRRLNTTPQRRFRTASALCLLLVFTSTALTQNTETPPRYLADLQLNTSQELHSVMQRVEQLLNKGELSLDTSHPIAFVLHGPEVRSLLKQNYSRHRGMVDLAAKLSALGVVDIRACETWMGGHRIDPADLHSFIGTVPYGPAEERRLLDDDYIYF